VTQTGRHPFSHHYLLAAKPSRALKSTGKPKKATPEGTPTFFPALLTALAPRPRPPTPSRRAGHRYALFRRAPTRRHRQSQRPPIAPTPSGLPLDKQRSFRDGQDHVHLLSPGRPPGTNEGKPGWTFEARKFIFMIMANVNVVPKQTAAFYVQAAISFTVSLTALGVGIVYLPVNGWMRAFLGVGLLYVVTSTFTLAKCVRDQQDASRVMSRVDEARLDHFLAEHDPFNQTL
jgi:hypothetical protein